MGVDRIVRGQIPAGGTVLCKGLRYAIELSHGSQMDFGFVLLLDGRLRASHLSVLDPYKASSIDWFNQSMHVCSG